MKKGISYLFSSLHQLHTPHPLFSQYLLIFFQTTLEIHYSFSSLLELQWMAGLHAFTTFLSYFHVTQIQTYQNNQIALFLCILGWILHIIALRHGYSLAFSLLYRGGSFFIFQLSVSIWVCKARICRSSSEQHLLLLGSLLAVLSLVELIFLGIRWDQNAWQGRQPKMLMSGQGGYSRMVKLLSRIVLIIGYQLISKANDYILVLIIVRLAGLYSIYNANLFSLSAQSCQLFAESFLFGVTVGNLVQHNFHGGHSDYSLVSILAFSVFFGVCITQVYSRSLNRLFLIPIQDLSPDQMHRVLNSMADSNHRILEVMIRHCQNNRASQCRCWTKIQNIVNMRITQQDLLKTLLVCLVRTFKKDWTLRHYLALFLSCCEGRVMKGYHTLLGHRGKLVLIEQFAVYEYRERTRSVITQLNNNRNSNNKNSIEQAAILNERVLVLQNTINTNVLNLIDLYEEMLKKIPRIQTILRLAVLLKDNRTKINSEFRSLASQDSDYKNARIRQLKQFYNKNQKLVRGEGLQRRLAVVSIMLFGRESGMIKEVNHDCQQLLGYQKNKLIGRQVAVLMPRPYRQLHPNFIEQFFIKRDDQIVYNRFSVPVVLSSGFVWLASLSLKIIIQSQSDLEMLGFIDLRQQKQGQFHIVYDHSGNCIVGLSQSLSQQIGISQLREQSFERLRMQKLLPCVQQDVIQGSPILRRLDRLVADFDLQYLRYQISQQNNEVELEKISTAVQLISDKQYNQTRIMIFRLSSLQSNTLFHPPSIRQVISNDIQVASNDRDPQAAAFDLKAFSLNQKRVKIGLLLVNLLTILAILILISLDLSILKVLVSRSNIVASQLYLNSQREQLVSLVDVDISMLYRNRTQLYAQQIRKSLWAFQEIQFSATKNEGAYQLLRTDVALSQSLFTYLVLTDKLAAFTNYSQFDSSLYYKLKDDALQLSKRINKLQRGCQRTMQKQLNYIFWVRLALLLGLVVWTAVNGALHLFYMSLLNASQNQIVQHFNRFSVLQIKQKIKRQKELIFSCSQEQSGLSSQPQVQKVSLPTRGMCQDYSIISFFMFLAFCYYMGQFLFGISVLDSFKPAINSLLLLQNSSVLLVRIQLQFINLNSRETPLDTQFAALAFDQINYNYNKFRHEIKVSPLSEFGQKEFNQLMLKLTRAQTGLSWFQQGKFNFLKSQQFIRTARQHLNKTSFFYKEKLVQSIQDKLLVVKSYEQIIFLVYILMVYVVSALNLRRLFMRHQSFRALAELSIENPLQQSSLQQL